MIERATRGQAEKDRRAAILKQLGPEPKAALKGGAKAKSEGSHGAVATVAVRLPDGSRRQRRFYAAVTADSGWNIIFVKKSKSSK